MRSKRTTLATPALVAAALLAIVGMASPVQASTPVSVAPNAWYIYKVYASGSSCRAAGEAFVATHYAKAYKCEWDSPGVALWLNSY